MTFGSDGGGGLYVADSRGCISHLPPALVEHGIYKGDEHRVHEVASTPAAFVELLADRVATATARNGP